MTSTYSAISHTAADIVFRTVQNTFAVLLASAVLISPFSYGQGSDSFPPVTDAMLQDPAPGDWLMWRRTLDSWGYSPCLLYTSPSPRDRQKSRMPSSA